MYSDGFFDVASSCSYAEKNNVLSRGQIASGDLPLDMNEQTNTCNFSIMILELAIDLDAKGSLKQKTNLAAGRDTISVDESINHMAVSIIGTEVYRL